MKRAPIQDIHRPIIPTRNSSSVFDLSILRVPHDVMRIEMPVNCSNNDRLGIGNKLKLDGKPPGTGRDNRGSTGAGVKVAG